MSAHDELKKLERAYDKAASKLRTLRDEIYPIGTKGRCKISGFRAAVISGSLYPDQIRTTSGHMSWRHFEIIELPSEAI